MFYQSAQRLADIPVFSDLYYRATALVGYDFEQAVLEITDSLNYNSHWYCYPLFGQPAGCFELDQVKRIISCYTNLQYDGKIPVYNPNDSAKSGIIAAVAECSTEDPKAVELALDQLYWATSDGRIKSGKVLRPRDAQKWGEQQDQPAESVGGADTAFDSIWSTAKKVVIGVGVAVGVYFGAQAYAAYRTTKKVVS